SNFPFPIALDGIEIGIGQTHAEVRQNLKAARQFNPAAPRLAVEIYRIGAELIAGIAADDSSRIDHAGEFRMKFVSEVGREVAHVTDGAAFQKRELHASIPAEALLRHEARIGDEVCSGSELLDHGWRLDPGTGARMRT